MNEAAISNKQSAVSQRLCLPIAYCLLLVTCSEAAKPCTVTGQVTSVTQLGLAESVLIDVGELDLGRGARSFEPAASRRYRSFRGGACIQ